jgi:DNA-binding transcriptional LysR family regulator
MNRQKNALHSDGNFLIRIVELAERRLVTRAIPIDVLRAFVAVVNARGFTRAAEELGRTQPTISLQVKRLEELIETPLFENTSRLTLTRAGETCLDYGQRLLRLHDDLFAQLAQNALAGKTVRLGLPGELAGLVMSGLGAEVFQTGGKFNVDISCDASENLIANYRLGQFDIALAVTAVGMAGEAAAQWRMPMAWVRAPGYLVRPGQPLRLVTTPENSCYRQLAVAALKTAGRPFEVVCASADFGVLKSAVASGLGVAAMMRGAAHDGLELLPHDSLARLPDVSLGLHFRPGALSVNAVKLASQITQLINNAGHALVAA